eukprot:751980-Hanusia_phi.AAC.1
MAARLALVMAGMALVGANISGGGGGGGGGGSTRSRGVLQEEEPRGTLPLPTKLGKQYRRESSGLWVSPWSMKVQDMGEVSAVRGTWTGMRKKLAYLEYRFSNIVVSSNAVKAAFILSVSGVLVVVGGLILRCVGNVGSWRNALFKAYALLNNAPGIDAVSEESTGYLLAANVLFVSGIFTFAVILGLVTSSIEMSVQNILEGNYRIVEAGHTLLLNWNSRTIPLLRQLAEAVKDGYAALPIVILAQTDGKEMRQRIQESLRDVYLPISVRAGNPCSLNELQDVCAGEASHVLLQYPERGEEDEQILSTQIACVRTLQEKHQPNRRMGYSLLDLHGVVVATSSVELAPELGFVPILRNGFTQQVIRACVTLQGITDVYEDILHAGEGSQIYVLSSLTWPWLQEQTFGEARKFFPSAVLLGWIEDGSKRIQLIPGGEEKIPSSSLLILLSSDHRIRCNKSPAGGREQEEHRAREEEERESSRKERVVQKLERCFAFMKKKFALRVLILNLGEERLLLQSIEESLAPGSSLLAHFPSSERSERLGKVIRDMGEKKNISTQVHCGSFLTMEKLREMGAAECDVVICLPFPASSSADTNDAQLLALAKVILPDSSSTTTTTTYSLIFEPSCPRPLSLPCPTSYTHHRV